MIFNNNIFPVCLALSSRCPTSLSKSGIGIIWSEKYPKLSSTGEHTVRFIRPMCRQIIYKDTYITLRTVYNEWLFIANRADGIYSRHYSLERVDCHLVRASSLQVLLIIRFCL